MRFMSFRGSRWLLHIVAMSSIVVLITFLAIYPFLPGEYDGLAVPLAIMAQASGVLGLTLVPVGGAWFLYEQWRNARNAQNPSAKTRSSCFASVALILCTIIVLVVALVGFASLGPSLGVLMLLLWLYGGSKLVQRQRLSNSEAREQRNVAPLYLIIVPIAVTLLQATLAAPATESSRNRAIAMSAELISDIEAYRAANGRYPSSLLAVWKDYQPAVVGIEKYHYVPDGDTFNLFFEQPRFLFDNIGTREFVVYNPLDKHLMVSHDSWILIFTPAELRTTQGWYSMQSTKVPHWRYFWFD